MQIYLPQSHVLDMAEDAIHTLHNLLPFRGTEVRDANGWSHYIGDACNSALRIVRRLRRCISHRGAPQVAVSVVFRDGRIPG